MKKRFLILILSLTAMLTCVFGLSACSDKEVSFKLKFIVDNEIYATIDMSGDEVVALPENPTKEKYSFDGWFWDKDVWEKPLTANSLLDAPLSSDMSVYAKFSLIHVCAFTEQVANDTFKATNATCEDKATYYYSCTCGEMGTQTFESGEALGHNFTNYLSDNNATCEVDGTKTAVCNRNGCNETDTITDEGSKLIPSEGLEYVLNSGGQSYSVTGIGTCEDTNIIIPLTYENKPVTSIDSYAFYECTSLTSVVIGDSVTSIGFDAFYGCKSLTSVYYNGTIDEWVQIEFYNTPLYYAKNLYINNQLVTDVNITSATKINAYAFYNCDSLTSVVIGDSVTSIGSSAFVGCSSLTNVTIGDSVTSIGSYAFECCTSLTNVVIPDSVTSIGDYAFEYCTSLTSIMVDENNKNYKSIDGNLYSKDGKTLIQYAIGKTDTAFTIPNSVTSIGSFAFYECTSLTSVVIPNSVTSIGVYAFSYCYSLTSIEIPNSVTSIGNYAFSSCSSLTSVVIGDSVTSIGYEAFKYCYKLVEVINKSSHITVTKSNSNGYLGYYALAIYNSGDTFTGTKLSNDNGYIVYTEGSEKILVAYNGSQTNLTIPNYITKINAYAFRYCTSLTSIEIPNSVTSIGDYAFYSCNKLTKVNYLGTIDEWVQIEFNNSYSNPLYYAKNLYIDNQLVTDVNITSATKINAYAFYNCDSLTSVTIGDSVTSIGSYAFYDCSKLTSLIFRDTSTWYRTTNSSDWNNKTNGTRAGVTSSSSNATYFKSTYSDYYWYKV